MAYRFGATGPLFRTLACLALALAMAACNSGGTGEGTDHFHVHRHSTGPASPPAATDADLAEMVAAVSATKSGAPVQMRFALKDHPSVSEPTALEVAVVPDAPAMDSLSIQFQGGDGLDVVEGGEPSQVAKPSMGAPVRRTLKVVPRHDGIFTLTAVVTIHLADETSTRTFAIPVIAGTGIPELAARDLNKGT
jgi:hypothetical protein